jgi:hypothetical protein
MDAGMLSVAITLGSEMTRARSAVSCAVRMPSNCRLRPTSMPAVRFSPEAPASPSRVRDSSLPAAPSPPPTEIVLSRRAR